jgi:hypothetical protein
MPRENLPLLAAFSVDRTRLSKITAAFDHGDEYADKHWVTT